MDRHIFCVAFSPDGRILAGSGAAWQEPGQAQFWAVETGDDLAVLNGEHSRSINSVAFSPDGRLLATGSWDKTIKLWDVIAE